MIHTELLKLDAPHQVIYCGGEVGLHVATLIVVDERRDVEGHYLGIETHSHPVVSYGDGGEGVVWNRAEVRDTTHLCMEGDEAVDLKRINDILSAEIGSNLKPSLLHITSRLKDLGIKINVPLREVMEQPKTLCLCFSGLLDNQLPYVYVISDEAVFCIDWADPVKMALELNTQQFAYEMLYPKDNRPHFKYCIDKEETYADFYSAEDGTLEEQYEAIDPEVKGRMEKLVKMLNDPNLMFPF